MKHVEACISARAYPFGSLWRPCEVDCKRVYERFPTHKQPF